MYEAWQSHSGLVARLARRMARPGVTPKELYNSGLIGLWEAATRYDPGRGVKFEVFAEPRVRGQMNDLIRETFGRRGKYRNVVRLDHMPGVDVAVCDKGLAAVDARDELVARTADPVEHVGRGVRGEHRHITWRGRTMILSDWAAELGLTPQGLIYRLDTWGIKQAMTVGKAS